MSKYFSEQFRRSRLDQNLSAEAFALDSLSRLSCNLPSQGRDVHASKVLSDLKKRIAAGNRGLPALLADISDASLRLTGATGAAIAMWKDGCMICRARSGETAPPLGAQLSVDSGISGACFRSSQVQNCADTETDPNVDVEVCRRLGLRSIVALPIEGWRSINGILEVFSDQPFAFTEQNISLLRQFAALAEQARAARPHGASRVEQRKMAAVENRPSSSLIPASDTLVELLSAFFGTRSRPLLLAGGVLAISMIAFSMWLGWRGAKTVERRAARSTPAAVDGGGIKQSSDTPLATPAAEPGKPLSRNESRYPAAIAQDHIWSRDPGGEALFISDGKPSAGVPVKFAAKIDRIEANKNSTKRKAKVATALSGSSAPAATQN